MPLAQRSGDFVLIAALVFALAAFTLSASAGLGGSFILVPALSLLFGAKQGIATAALLLALNNVAKVIAYRTVIPIGACAAVLVMTAFGSVLGARMVASAPETVVAAAVVVSFASALLLERRDLRRAQRVYAPVLAFAGGAASGFSGTSGPLKGLALRSLRLDRVHFVGAGAVVSLTGDATKTLVFAQAGMVDRNAQLLVALAVPVAVAGTLLGRRINRDLGERAFTTVFWVVIAMYAVRIIARL